MRIGMIYLGIALILSSGCCTPQGCGFGCRALDGCYDCEGGFGPPRIPHGPIDGLRQAKRSLVCGRGCGEVYYGEWISTPPDCCDPCCGDQFVGGAVRCTPFCWEPGTLLRHLYGRRMCACGESDCDSCNCDDSVMPADGLALYSESAGSGGCDCGHNSPSIGSSSFQMTPVPRTSGATSGTRAIATPQRLPPRGADATAAVPQRVEAVRRAPQPVRR